MTSPIYPPSLALSPVSGPVSAVIRLPGSKSITNRALLLASLCDGASTLHGPLHSEDTNVMSWGLHGFGADVSVISPTDDDFYVTGYGVPLANPSGPIEVANSGTTMRFLTAAACLSQANRDVILDGNARMRERPIRDLIGALLTLGVECEAVNGSGCPPVRVKGGGLYGGKCRLRGDVSSQFLSAILQIAPYAKNDVEIEIVGELVSKPYIDITQSVMAAFGVTMENDGYKRLRVPAGQRYEARDYVIEADASNASYFLAAAAVTGGTVMLENLGADSIQGDVKFADVLETMGCAVTRGAQITLTGPDKLRAVDADMTGIPDTAQTLAVVCAFADGPSHLTGIGSLRVKETDRVRAIAVELPKLGCRVEEGPDFWMIYPNAVAPSDLPIATYDDHRMAMSFAVAGLRQPVTIADPACVAKTFPNFWECWRQAFPSE